MHLSFCYLRWRQHPERVASIKSMNASELSRRRLKVNTSDPLPPADHMMEDARQDEMSDDAEESHEVPPSAIPEHLNEDIEESDGASHSEAKGDGGDRETTECDTLDYTMAKAEKVTDDENDGSESMDRRSMARRSMAWTSMAMRSMSMKRTMRMTMTMRMGVRASIPAQLSAKGMSFPRLTFGSDLLWALFRTIVGCNLKIPLHASAKTRKHHHLR